MNYWGRLGAPMVQPTKDELLQMIEALQKEIVSERGQRRIAELKLSTANRRLDIAARMLGEHIMRRGSLRLRLQRPSPSV
jgi:hypothetical protein